MVPVDVAQVGCVTVAVGLGIDAPTVNTKVANESQPAAFVVE